MRPSLPLVSPQPTRPAAAPLATQPIAPQSATPLAAEIPAEKQPAIAAKLPGIRYPYPETASVSIIPILALAQPHNLALAVVAPSAFTISAAATGAIQSAMLHNLARLGPIVAASQKPDLVAPAVASTITADQLQSLPVSGRRWQEFLPDSPAAGPATESAQTSFRGATAQSAEITVDGLSTRLAFGVTAGSGNSSASDPASPNASPQSSMSGAWAAGRGPGHQRIRNPRSHLHRRQCRSRSDALRRRPHQHPHRKRQQRLARPGLPLRPPEYLGRAQSLHQWVQNTGSVAAPNFTAQPYTPPDHEIVWGLGMGSRIRRDKLFWFAALDSYHRNDPGVATVKNPAEFFNLPEPTSAAVTLLSAQLGESQNQAYNDFLGVTRSGYAPAGLEQLAALARPRAAHRHAMGRLCPHRLAGRRAPPLHARRHRRRLERARRRTDARL